MTLIIIYAIDLSFTSVKSRIVFLCGSILCFSILQKLISIQMKAALALVLQVILSVLTLSEMEDIYLKFTTIDNS